MEWLEPWRSAKGWSENSIGAFERQLQVEIDRDDPIFGIPVRIIGRGNGDDAVFELPDGSGRVAFVHLQWEKARDPGRLRTRSTVFASLDEFSEKVMRPEHADWLLERQPFLHDPLKGFDCKGDKVRLRRWKDFRRRVAYSPESVYRHALHGWEYIPVHPFGDESELLARLGIKAEDCRIVDAWWGIGSDAVLLQVWSQLGIGGTIELFALPQGDPTWRISLLAQINASFVTRADFEGVMTAFASEGFPQAAIFQLSPGAGRVAILRK
jgi:hypothetical protein